MLNRHDNISSTNSIWINYFHINSNKKEEAHSNDGKQDKYCIMYCTRKAVVINMYMYIGVIQVYSVTLGYVGGVVIKEKLWVF